MRDENAMMKIAKIGHATFETTDLARQLDYYTEVLGLSVIDKSAKSAVLACPADHSSVVVHQGAKHGCVRLTLELAPGSEAKDVTAHLTKSDVKWTQKSDAQPGVAQTITVTNPDGLPVDL